MAEIQMSSLGLVDEWRKPAHRTQYLAALSASMGAMAVGSAIGYSSPASAALLAKPPTNTSENTTSVPEWLAENDHQLTLTPMENNWFAASLSAGALVGCVIAGFSLNTLGRKGTMLASLVPLMLGWALIGFAQNIGMLVTGRVLCGLCTGITSLVCPTYTTEYASKDIRGALGSGFQLFITIGILYAYLFGAVVESWRWLVLVCAAVGGVYLLLAMFIKESPTFLLSKGKEEEARQSMQYFRGKSYDIEPEMKALKESLEEAAKNKVSLSDLREPYILKPLAITLALMVFQQLAGVNAVIYNINLIFQASGTSISDDLSSIIVGIVQVIATAAGSLLIDRAGRKLLLCFSAFTMSVSIVSLGVFFYIKSSNESFAQEFLGWLPLTSLMIFISAFSIGYGPIPWVMMGELFYPNVKEAAGSMATTLNWTFVFIVTFVFAPLQDAIHDYGAYWLFGGLCAVNFLFCVLFVPETKGRTLQETMAHFGGPAA